MLHLTQDIRDRALRALTEAQDRGPFVDENGFFIKYDSIKMVSGRRGEVMITFFWHDVPIIETTQGGLTLEPIGDSLTLQGCAGRFPFTLTMGVTGTGGAGCR